MNNKYKIIATDLDGTLLDNDQTVSRENLLALEKMHRLGIELVPSTGRTLVEIPREISASPYVRYFIISDGAAVWDKLKGKTIISNYLPRSVVKFVIDTLSNFKAFVIVHEGGKAYRDENNSSPEKLKSCRIDDYYSKIISTRSIPKSDFYNYILNSDRVEMFTLFFDTDEALSKCRRILTESGVLCTSQSASFNLEVYYREAGKGIALTDLARALCVPIEEVIAVGDSMNDSSLIQCAGLGLAMKNACEELKSLADRTICRNDEHCLEYILDNIINDE